MPLTVAELVAVGTSALAVGWALSDLRRRCEFLQFEPALLSKLAPRSDELRRCLGLLRDRSSSNWEADVADALLAAGTSEQARPDVNTLLLDAQDVLSEPSQFYVGCVRLALLGGASTVAVCLARGDMWSLPTVNCAAVSVGAVAVVLMCRAVARRESSTLRREIDSWVRRLLVTMESKDVLAGESEPGTGNGPLVSGPKVR